MATTPTQRSGPSPQDPPLAARPAHAYTPKPEALGVQRAPRDAAQRQRAADLATESAEEAVRSAAADGRSAQAASLAVMAIKDGHEADLRTVLATIEAEDCETNHLVPFLRLRTVHFARFVVYDAELRRHVTQDPAAPGLLLFATDFDGVLADHVEEITNVASSGFDQVFQHCEGYAPNGGAAPAVKRYILQHQHPTSTFYCGTRRRSVVQVRREKLLRDHIEDFLDRERGGALLQSGDAVKIREAIRNDVFAAFPWAKEEPGSFPAQATLKVVGALAAAVLGPVAVSFALLGKDATLFLLGMLGTLLAALLAAAFAYLRYLEITDLEAPPVDDLKKHVSDLAEVEDQIVQNQMTSVRRVKLGSFRIALLRSVLFAIDKVARWLQVEGSLAGIPSIHFARWFVLDEGRTLVFFSNFDGSWENYLGDFIDKSATGLTAVWSNCVGFPATCCLVRRGARNERKFKDYTRDSQIGTSVWYSAYKTLSVPNINANTRIRLGLYGAMTPEEAKEWLRRL